MAFQKSIAQSIGWTMYSSTDHVTPTVPTNLVVTIDKDGGGFGAPAGASASLGNGACRLQATIADMTADLLTVYATGTGVDPVTLQVYTEANWTAARATLLDTITTIANRIGSWTGSARNTILGAFQALFRSDADATVPSDVNADLGSGAGDASNITDSTEAIRDRGDSAWPTATGFATPTNISDLQTHGDSAWPTATGFATPGAQMDLVNAPNVTAVLAIQAGLALEGADGDTLETLSDQIDALGAGSGAFVITLTVKQAGVAVQGVPVTLQATAGNNVQTSLADGTVQYNRDAGSWAWVIEDTAGYTGSSGTVVVNSSGVVTSPAGGVVTITAIALPVAVNPTGCACYMDMLNADGLTPVGAGLGSLRVAKLIARSAGDTLVWADDKDNDAPRLTNAAGRVSIELPQGRTFILVATWPDGRETTVEFLVPVLASKDVGQYFQPYTAA